MLFFHFRHFSPIFSLSAALPLHVGVTQHSAFDQSFVYSNFNLHANCFVCWSDLDDISFLWVIFVYADIWLDFSTSCRNCFTNGSFLFFYFPSQRMRNYPITVCNFSALFLVEMAFQSPFCVYFYFNSQVLLLLLPRYCCCCVFLLLMMAHCRNL